VLLRLANRIHRRLLNRDLAVWYSPNYRLPLAGLEGLTGMEPRRADFAMWYLLDRRVVPFRSIRSPVPITYAELARVHTESYLESLGRPETLARIFAATPQEIAVDEVMHTVRVAAGATIAAARETLRTRKPTLNMLGGFHHAGPGFGAGFCPVNDIAAAIAAVRAEGFQGRVCVIDLDAHPPDGTAACLKSDPKTWIGSISGCDWGPLDNVDETVLPTRADDATYLRALEALLKRMPKPDLAFVLASGDVLAIDRLGGLGLSLDGARQRDLLVGEAIADVPSVWLAAGGYNAQGWRVLAGTAIALSLRTRRPIRKNYEPMTARFALIASGLSEKELGSDVDAANEDLAAELGLGRRGPKRLLGFYTAEGVEYALFRYGILGQIERLGYSNLRNVIDEVGQGDRHRLFGTADGKEHLLVESVLEKQRIEGRDFLYVHWLTLRHPRVPFDGTRPKLPGQETPGLGMARESGEMLARIAMRLGYSGVAYRPAWYHTAYSGRYRFRFIDPERQARWEALLRDLGKRPLLEVTTAMAEGRVRLNGEPYQWEPDAMVFMLDEEALPKAPPEKLEHLHFTLDEAKRSSAATA
jgi:acetoin utilization deacetylase AcuC-like enzyme